MGVEKQEEKHRYGKTVTTELAVRTFPSRGGSQ